MKLCRECKILKDKSNFTKRKTSEDGLRESCKECNKNERIKSSDRRSEYQKEYRAKNPEKIKKDKSQHYINNKSRYLASSRASYSRRYNSDIGYRIKLNLRSRMNLAIKHGRKSDKTEVLLGCKIQDFMEFLESKFVDGMNWDSRSDWHIDHIRPCASFDLSDPEQQKQCFHYTNLQPLWAQDNLAKRDKWML